jgi:hypothetical protein
MISLVLLPADSNIAANALPSGWQPYLWLAWPIGALLAAPLIIWEMRKTLRDIRPSTGDTPERDADEMDGSRPSDAGTAVRRRGGLISSLDRQFGFSRFDRRYRDFVAGGLRYIDLKGLATVGFYTPELDEVFVDLSLMPSSPHDVPQGVLSGAPITGSVNSLSDFLDRPEPALLVVVGGPGMGKTSLLVHHVWQMCHTYHDRRRTVPIVLYLRDHVGRILAHPEHSVADVVRDTLDHTAMEPAGWFEWRLTRGDCVVHLDGLDEVADQADRRALANWVERQVARFPNNDYLITSRPQGYQTARINGATVLRVLRMTDSQVDDFVGRWYQAFERAVERYNRITTGKHEAAADRARDAARDLLDRLAQVPALYDLTANPMLLTMIMNVHRFRGTLPSGRVDLYEEICKVMLGRRQEAKEIPAVLAADKKEMVLRLLAFDMMRRHVRDLRQADAIDIVEPTLRRLSNDLSASEFLADVSTGGFFVERENGLYAFAHQTFQEYLASAQIRDKGLIDVLTAAVDDVWWRETTLLYAVRSDADPIVEACLESNSVMALSLAFDCEAQSSEIAPYLRERLKRLLGSALDPEIDRQRRKVMAGVMVTRHLRRSTATAGASRICADPVSTGLYRLYLMDTQSQPWDEPWLVDPGDEKPIRGIYGREAAAFAQWAGTVAGGEQVCRLPTRAELDDPVVRRAVAASAQCSEFGVWVRSGPSGTGLELWTSTACAHPYLVDGEILAQHLTDDVRRITTALAGMLLLESVLLLPALARTYALAVASATPLRGDSATELAGALLLAGKLDPSLDLARTLELVGRLNTYRPHGRTRSRDDDLPRAIATSHTILPPAEGSSGRLARPDTHALDTAAAGDGARGAALIQDVVRDLVRMLRAVRASISEDHPAHVLAVDRSLDAGIDVAFALDRLLRDSGAHEDTLPRAITRHRVLARGDLPDHGLDVFLGRLLSTAVRGLADGPAPAPRRDDHDATDDAAHLVIEAAGVLSTQHVVSPDNLSETLARALELVRARSFPDDRPAWALGHVADRLEAVAVPVFTWQRTLTPADATAIRVAALCLAVECDDDDRLTTLLREIAAGVTLLERRTDGRAPVTETLVLATA